MRLVIFTDFDFERLSSAGWSRIINYSRALIGEETQIHITSSAYDYSNNVEKTEYLPGIYLYKGSKTEAKATYEDLHFKRYLKYFKWNHEYFKTGGNTVFFLYNSKLASVLTSLSLLVLIKRERVFIEKNELKFAIGFNLQYESSSVIKNASFLFYKIFRIILGGITDLLAFFYTGIIVISTRFEKIYGAFRKKVLRIPILIDVSCQASAPEEGDKFRVGYFGWMLENKDGVFSLIESVKLIITTNKQIELHLYGGVSSSLKKKFESKIDSPNIIYHGAVPSDKVSEVMGRHELLVLPRPKNLQTMYGFSTKLGEYLITGIPVLTTDVSDNPHYLKDGENAFVLPAGEKIDIKTLSSKLETIINTDFSRLSEIGKNGRETALRYFNSGNYSRELKQFLFD